MWNRFLIGLLAAVCFQTAVFAQATRTWVSGVGDDANPCSRTAPCKTWAGAISKTSAGGTISALDPGGFGAVTITKSITLEGNGTLASILAQTTQGVVINAGTSDVVVLRYLLIDGGTGGTNGIRFIAGGALYVENCSVQDFTNGIFANPNNAAKLFVKDTNILNNSTGALLQTGLSGSISGVFDNVRFEGSGAAGIRAEDRTNLTLKNCLAAGSGTNGFLAFSSGGGPVDMDIYQSIAVHNVRGIHSNGANARVRISDVLVSGNVDGLVTANGGTITSFQNNHISGNSNSNGAPTNFVAQQ